MPLNLEAALKIKGLMETWEIEAIAKLAQGHRRILEIGSFTGRSTVALADNSDGFVIACDDFWGPRDSIYTWKDRQEIYKTFLENVGERVAPKICRHCSKPNQKIVIWKINHAEMTPHGLYELLGEDNAKLDMIFVDGAHDYESVKRDIQFSLSVLAPGGLLCGHDFGLHAPDVLRAVSEFFKADVKVDVGAIWSKTI